MSEILVVDDEAAICHVVAHLLGKQGHRVTACGSGLAAVDMIAGVDFAAALVDLNLGDVHGNQVIRAARTMKPALPLVVMSAVVAESGRSPPDFLGMSIRIGGLYRLAKPFKPSDLIDLVAQILAPTPQAGDVPMRRSAG